MKRLQVALYAVALVGAVRLGAAEENSGSADKRPRVAAAARTKLVVCNAEPVVHWGAASEHGIGRVWFTCDVVHAYGAASQQAKKDATAETEVYRIAADARPQPSLIGRRPIALGGLGLAVGDTVKVIFHAAAAAEARTGEARRDKISDSKPVVFQVTDADGAIAGVLDSAPKSERKIIETIKSQIGISTGGVQ